jgi:hypothetical protein
MVWQAGEEAATPISMGDDGSGSDVTLPAVGLSRTSGEALRNLLAAARVHGERGRVHVVLEGVEVALATFGSAQSASHPLGWVSRPARDLARCGVASDAAAAVAAVAQHAAQKASGQAAKRVEVSASGEADLAAAVRLGEGGSAACVPPERSFPMNEHAFDDAEWEAMWGRSQCA